MAGLTVFLYVLVVIASVLLIGLILLQPAKSGGMGAAFGGVGESVFGGKASNHLTKATVYLTAIFFIIALALAALIGHGVRISGASDSNVDALLSEAAKKAEAPAKKAEAPVRKAAAPARKAAAPARKAAAPAKKAEAPAKKAAAPAKKAAAPAKKAAAPAKKAAAPAKKAAAPAKKAEAK